MKTVITDYTFEVCDIERAELELAGHGLVAKRAKTVDELVDLVNDADCVITQFATVNATVIAAMRRARAIVRYGIGVDNVDLEAARSHHIPVCNVPDYCIDEVADHTLALMLSLTRGTVATAKALSQGEWRLAWPAPLMQSLKELTVGVIGFGRIGREVCRRVLGFRATVLVFDPAVDAQVVRDAGGQPATLDQLLAQSDVITLHCPSIPQTRGLINRDTLAKTKKGVRLVNVARGDIVDQDALIAGLQSGHVGAAALDVMAQEPLPADHLLRNMENVVLTPHVASVSPVATARLRQTVVQTALKALRGEALSNNVNGISMPRIIV